MPGTRHVTVLMVFAAWVCVNGLPAHAAEGADSEALRKQTEEVERLQHELQKAQAELRRLETAERTSTDGTSQTALPPNQGAAEARPARDEEPGWDAMPELTRTSLVKAEDLVRQFKTDPSRAKKRYRGKTFLVEGTVTDYGLPKFVRRYDLELKSPEAVLSVACRFDYVNSYRTVYEDEDGRLVGRLDANALRVVSHRGETVVIQGRCRGMKGNRLEFTDCKRIRLP